MKKILEGFPEIIFLDTTYNMLSRQLVVMVLCIQDSNGFTQIVGIGILANETAETLKKFFENFRDHNESIADKIHAFMTDKDLTERSVLKDVFPNANLYICEFHVLKIFAAQITMSKMKISSEKRDEVLDWLDKLVKSNSKEEYDKLYQGFCNVAPETVLSYFNQNWHNIQPQWTRWSMKKNFGNYTNNPVETTHFQLKNEIPRRAPLKTFIDNFFLYYYRRNDTIKKKLGETLYKIPIRGFEPNSPEFLYQQLLTSKGFDHLMKQFVRHDSISCYESCDSFQVGWIQCNFKSLRVSVNSCECNDFISWELPCRHLLAVRKLYQLPLFDKSLCPERWTRQYNIEHQPTLQNVKKPHVSDLQTKKSLKIPVQRMPAPNYNTHQQRLKSMLEVTNNIARAGSLVSKQRYEHRLEVLEKILQAFSNDEDVEVIVKNRKPLPKVSTLAIDDTNKAVDYDQEHFIENVVMPSPVRLRGRPKNIDKCHTSVSRSKSKSSKTNRKLKIIES